MATQINDTKTTFLMLLLAIWLVIFAYSLVFLWRTPDEPAATLPELRRTVGFFGWQGVAGMVAIGCWGIGWAYPKGSGIRRISALPVAAAVAMVLVVSGMALFG